MDREVIIRRKEDGWLSVLSLFLIACALWSVVGEQVPMQSKSNLRIVAIDQNNHRYQNKPEGIRK